MTDWLLAIKTHHLKVFSKQRDSYIAENKKINYVNQKYNKTKQLKTISKPNLFRLNPELSSKCIDIQKSETFNYFVRLSLFLFCAVKNKQFV